MGIFYKKNVFIDAAIALILICGIFTLLLSIFWLSTGGYTDFSCIRSPGQTECILSRTYRFSKSSDIKIPNPIAVDISETYRKDIFGNEYSSYGSGGISRAEIRSKGVSYKINIYSGYDRQAVRAVAKDINEFLLSSNAPSFHKRF
jgi:hypothetical protein